MPSRLTVAAVSLIAVAALGLGALATRALTADGSAVTQDVAVALLKPSYGTVLAKVGSPLQAGTPAWDDALERSVSALLAARPADCSLPSWALMRCGNHIYDVPSQAMEPSILSAEQVIAVGVTEAQPVRRGDIVAYKGIPSPGAPATVYAHRIVGLPGERVALVDGVVRIDGRPLPLRPVGGPIADDDGTGPRLRFIETTPEGASYEVVWPADHAAFGPFMNMAEVTVPPGHYFVMGDNRSRASDSRYPSGPGLPGAADIQARIVAIFASRDASHIGRSLDLYPASTSPTQ